MDTVNIIIFPRKSVELSVCLAVVRPVLFCVDRGKKQFMFMTCDANFNKPPECVFSRSPVTAINDSRSPTAVLLLYALLLLSVLMIFLTRVD